MSTLWTGPALDDSDRVLKCVFAAMSEGVVIHGPGGEILEANPAALSILGLNRDELMGRTSADPRWRAVRKDGTAFPGYDHPAMFTLRTGRALRDQLMGVHDPARGLRWISINSNPIWGDDSGSPAAVVTTFADITERKVLEARLAANAAELQDLYDNSPSAYHSLDATGTFIRINATALRWMGRAEHEVIGKASPADFLDAQGQAQFHRKFAELKANGAVQGMEANLITDDGVARRLSLSSSAVTDAAGQFVMSRSVAHDITALHEARERLKQLSQEQAAMLQTDLIGIAKVRDRHFTWVNSGVTQLFGYPPGELIGQSTRMLYCSDEHHRVVGEAAKAHRAAGQPFRVQLELRRKDGEHIWIDMSSVQLSPDAGISMGIFVDITALKQAEAKRLEFVKLQAENQQVRETSRLKSAFLANMSHELRTPLNAVTGYAHLLRAGAIGPDSPKFERFLSQISASGRYLQELIEDMLSYAEVESGKLEIHPSAIDLAAMAREVLDMLESDIAGKQLEITVDIQPELGTLFADPLRIKQVLANFIANAVKFTAGHGHIAVRAMACGADAVRVEVEDDGIGIAESDLPLLFIQFEQLSSGSGKSHAGIGLGLALSRRLMEAQGGSVGVRSQLGVGSVFHLELPQCGRAA